MKKFAAALVAAAVLSLPLAVSAQDDHHTQTQAVTRYTFEDHPVAGRDYSAEGEILRVRTRQGHGSLIRIREHFVNEMLKSAEHF